MLSGSMAVKKVVSTVDWMTALKVAKSDVYMAAWMAVWRACTLVASKVVYLAGKSDCK